MNVGLYLIKSDLISLVQKNKFLGMDAFIKKVQKRKGSVGVFPIDEESWVDVGQKIINFSNLMKIIVLVNQNLNLTTLKDLI